MISRASKFISWAGFSLFAFAVGGCSRDSAIGAPKALTAPARSVVHQGTNVGAAAAFHQRNPVDWVGQAHNQLVEGYERHMAAGKLLSGTFCDDITAYVASRTDLLPVGVRVSSQRLLIAANAAMTMKCRGFTSHVGRASFELVPPRGSWTLKSNAYVHFAALSTRSSLRGDPSTDAAALIDEITTAVDEASDADDLASTLSGILDVADTLSDTTYTTIVNATASVAQSSFEEWIDGGEVESYYNEYYDNNSSCFGDLQPPPIDAQAAMDACVGTGLVRYSWPTPRLKLFRAASMRMSCPGLSARNIIEADVVGGAAGAYAGVAAGGVGALPGAVAGGGVASIADAGFQVGAQLFCALFGF